MCALPRANHALRTVPPLDIADYAQARDDPVGETLQACLGRFAFGEADGGRKLATLLASFGGLGLASAVRTAPAAPECSDGTQPPSSQSGRSARPGEQSRMARAHRWRLTEAPVTGRMAGSTVCSTAGRSHFRLTERWWAILAVAVQQAVSSRGLGSPCAAPPHASQFPGPEP